MAFVPRYPLPDNSDCLSLLVLLGLEQNLWNICEAQSDTKVEFALDGRLAPSIHLDDPLGPLYPEILDK